jgi:hypothetical protein
MVARAPGNISGEATTQRGNITYEAMRQHPVYIKSLQSPPGMGVDL